MTISNELLEFYSREIGVQLNPDGQKTVILLMNKAYLEGQNSMSLNTEKKQTITMTEWCPKTKTILFRNDKEVVCQVGVEPMPSIKCKGAPSPEQPSPDNGPFVPLQKSEYWKKHIEQERLRAQENEKFKREMTGEPSPDKEKLLKQIEKMKNCQNCSETDCLQNYGEPCNGWKPEKNPSPFRKNNEGVLADSAPSPEQSTHDINSLVEEISDRLHRLKGAITTIVESEKPIKKYNAMDWRDFITATEVKMKEFTEKMNRQQTQPETAHLCDTCSVEDCDTESKREEHVISYCISYQRQEEGAPCPSQPSEDYEDKECHDCTGTTRDGSGSCANGRDQKAYGCPSPRGE